MPPYFFVTRQPIDAGHIGANLKAHAKLAWESWMEKTSEKEGECNWEKWERGGFTASEKRVLSTWIFGEAYESIRSPKAINIRRSAFEKGACAITLSGKGHH